MVRRSLGSRATRCGCARLWKTCLRMPQQHSPEGAPVILTLASEDRDDGTWAVIEVSDEGPGIAAEVLPQLFERFAKGAGSEGLGLGLHLADQIATAHGGALDAASPLTGGTRFRMLLPI